MDAPPKSIHLGSRVSLDVAGLTHVGRERSRNEDQFMVARLERNLRIEATSVDGAQRWLPGSTEGTVIVVADGMGGTVAGDVASTVAVQSIADYVVNVLPWADARARDPSSARDPSPTQASPTHAGPTHAGPTQPAPTQAGPTQVAPTQAAPTQAAPTQAGMGFRNAEPTLHGIRVGLSKALVEGDAKVRSEAVARGAGTMGTTITVAYVQWPHLYVAHAGDSRCYLKRGTEIVQLTTDHTLANKLRAHVDESIDESSPWHHVLWNALGGGDHSAIEPEVLREQLYDGDTLVVCSDGLTKHVSDGHIAAALERCPRAVDACQLLVDLALDDGGSDNITVVVARCVLKDDPQDSEGPTRKRPNFEETLPLTPAVDFAHEETMVDLPTDSDGPTLTRGSPTGLGDDD